MIRYFSIFGLILFIIACNNDDDLDQIPDLTGTQILNIEVPANTISRICLENDVLELLDQNSITTVEVCNAGSVSTALLMDFEINPPCLLISPAPYYEGFSPDTICTVHCFDTTPENCDTTYVTVEIQRSFFKGVIVTNEGVFQNGTGSITYYNPITQETEQNVFSSVNSFPLGNIVQSAASDQNYLYTVVNNSDKIEIASLVNLESISTINGFSLPRYFCKISNEKAYVSQWGSDGVSGTLAVVNLTSGTIENTIPVGSGPEHLICSTDMVFVANSGGFGRDSTVTLIDPLTDMVIRKTIAGDNPVNVLADKRGQVWTLARGYSDFVNPSNNTDGLLSILGVNAVFKSIDVPNGSENLAYDIQNDRFYYTSQAKVWLVDISGMAGIIPTPEVFIDKFYYRLGVQPGTGHLYAADAGDFQSPGKVDIYDASGTKVTEFGTGIVPGGFHFRD